MNQRSLSISELTSASMSIRNKHIHGANNRTFTHLRSVHFGRFGVKTDHTLIPHIQLNVNYEQNVIAYCFVANLLFSY